MNFKLQRGFLVIKLWLTHSYYNSTCTNSLYYSGFVDWSTYAVPYCTPPKLV